MPRASLGARGPPSLQQFTVRERAAQVETLSARLPLSSAKPGRKETTRATIAIAATRAAFTVRTAGTPMPKIWGSAPEPQCPVDRDQGFLKAVVQCNGLGQLKASSWEHVQNRWFTTLAQART